LRVSSAIPEFMAPVPVNATATLLARNLRLASANPAAVGNEAPTIPEVAAM